MIAEGSKGQFININGNINSKISSNINRNNNSNINSNSNINALVVIVAMVPTRATCHSDYVKKGTFCYADTHSSSM